MEAKSILKNDTIGNLCCEYEQSYIHNKYEYDKRVHGEKGYDRDEYFTTIETIRAMKKEVM